MTRLLLVLLLATLTACDGGGTAPTPPPPNPFTFTISPSGVSPRELTVPQGTRVLFVNSGNRPRNMTSDPHPEHDDPGCEGINNVGPLNVGQSRETGNLVVARTCGFHDHHDPDNSAVRGRIIIRP